MKHVKHSYFVGLIFLLAACSPPAEPAAALRIAISPAAQPVSSAVANCAPGGEDLFMSIDVRYPSVVELEEYDLFIRLGEPQDLPAFAAQLAWERVVVVLNSDNKVNLTITQVADIFSGRVANWSELGGQDGAIALWVGPASDETRQAFEERVLLGSPVFGAANLAADPQLLLDAIAADPFAAGLLPAAWADESGQQIELGLDLPVLAISDQEPSGAAALLLACLQSANGQSLLSEHYRSLQP